MLTVERGCRSAEQTEHALHARDGVLVAVRVERLQQGRCFGGGQVHSRLPCAPSPSAVPFPESSAGLMHSGPSLSGLLTYRLTG